MLKRAQSFRILSLAACFLAASLASAAQAQDVNQTQPVIHSKTVITIFAKGTVPKAMTVRDDSSAPELQNPVKQAPVNPDAPAEEDITNDETDTPEEDGAETAPPSQPKKPEPPKPVAKFEVQVRREQLALNNGIYTKYQLDGEHGVLTYFEEASPRELSAENIYEPVDILFVRDDGIIAQIMPNIMLAYLSDHVQVEFPVRAYLYLEAGMAEAYGLKPGDRIEHVMFKPSPIVKGE